MDNLVVKARSHPHKGKMPVEINVVGKGIFPCPDDCAAVAAEEMIRSRYSLIGGEINRGGGGITILSKQRITDRDVYEFVDFIGNFCIHLPIFMACDCEYDHIVLGFSFPYVTLISPSLCLILVIVMIIITTTCYLFFD
jgi:hypothetical protein